MVGGSSSRAGLVALYLVAVAAVTAAVWLSGHAQALGPLAARGRSDLALAADRLVTQLQRSRDFAVVMADHPALAARHERGAREVADAVLLDAADKAGILRAVYVDREGRVLAASDRGGLPDPAAPYFARALHGALGSRISLEGGDRGRRVFTFAAPHFGPDGKVRGVLVASVDMAGLERDWRGSLPTVYFTDAQGRVVATNRSELLFWRREGPAAMVSPEGKVHSGEIVRRGGHAVLRQDVSSYVPRRALVLREPLPVIGLEGTALIDVGPARRIATWQAAAVAAVCLFFGAVLFLVTERRRALAAANAALETRVAHRTEALSEANAALRREVAEREEAEAALKRAQAELVQAGKLSALGQMSAGISHELNQPLMAIRSFAENGAAFLERGRTGRAADSFARIGDMAHRMARIIRNLRAFARQEAEPATQVGLADAVDRALDMLEGRIAECGAVVDWRRPERGPVVMAGEVRLTQVVVNLVSNALDAMAGREEKRIEIFVEPGPSPGSMRLSVRDTGPGIAEPDRIFDPFYTTKEVGGEGMGLGLSISYGMVQSFGGRLRGGNAPGGGAVFTVELEEAREVA